MKNQARRIGWRPKWPMSAYSASAPVMTSTTAPIAMKVIAGCAKTNDTAYVGDRPRTTLGSFAIWATPTAASATNHSRVIGPNSAPTRPVPNRWAANSPARITAAIGTT